MRCTRCDGLAVPQAVGIAPDGRVVFGWCLQCLADKQCRLVEVAAAGPWDLRLSFSTTQTDRLPLSGGGSSAAGVDQSQWILAIVAFLMISWGLILLAAGLFSGSRAMSPTSPLGNGTSQLLGIGGAVTAVLGLALMILASSRNWLPGTFLLALLSWLSLLAGVGILVYGIFDFEPGRNVQVVLGAGVALAISLTTRLLERSAKRKLEPPPLPKPWKHSASAGKSSAGETRRQH
jgi:hypothetical protein